MLPIAGCQGVGAGSSDLFYPDAGFRGGVVADEPQAALVGRDVLEAGGAAADAMAAMGLALAVTYPHAVGLGGGGSCVAYDNPKKATVAYDFRPGSPKGGGAVAVPGLARGLALLQARHGILEWPQATLPAEKLARNGFVASRAMVRPLSDVGPLLRGAPELSGTIGGTGGVPTEGANLDALPLAATLGQLRTRGPGDLYQGQTAQNFIDAANRAGGRLSLDDLRAYRVSEGSARLIDHGNHVLVLPSAPTPGVAAFAELFKATADQAMAEPGVRAKALASASRDAYAGAPGTVAGRDDGSTAAVAVDSGGSAVACTFTMGAPLGAGRASRELGMIFAAARGNGGRHMVPALVVNLNSRSVYWAGAAAADDSAPVALMQTWLDSMGTNAADLQQAIAAPRLIDAGGGIVHEPGTSAEALAGLSSLGERMTEAGPLGRVAAVWCPKGMAGSLQSCRFASDPRGFGLATPARKKGD